MRVLYIASGLFGLAGIGIGLALIKVQSALDAWWTLASIFSGGMLGLFLLGYFARKVRKINAAIAVVIGVMVIFWLSLSPVYFNHDKWILFKSPFHANLTIVIGTVVIFLTGFLLSGINLKNKKIKIYNQNNFK